MVDNNEGLPTDQKKISVLVIKTVPKSVLYRFLIERGPTSIISSSFSGQASTRDLS
jgi:hypothetical protein